MLHIIPWHVSCLSEAHSLNKKARAQLQFIDVSVDLKCCNTQNVEKEEYKPVMLKTA
jgi:hypothetical protein